MGRISQHIDMQICNHKSSVNAVIRINAWKLTSNHPIAHGQSNEAANSRKTDNKAKLP